MMRSTVLSLVVASTTILCALAQNPEGKLYNSALCFARSSNCTESQSKLSGACELDTFTIRQPEQCVKQACTYCELYGNSNAFPCNKPRLVRACDKYKKNNPAAIPQGRPSPSPKAKPTKAPGKCVWTARGYNIVVNIGAVKPARFWTPVMRQRFKGLIYRKNRESGIDQPGKGVICLNLRAKFASYYYMTAVSYAPDNTENNDFWVKSSKGFNHHKNKRMFKTPPGKWRKAYQNTGPKKLSQILSTKDFDAHTFIVPNVKANEKFTVCISGRSSRFELYRLIFVSCRKKRSCLWGNVKGFPVSPCV